MRYFEKTLNSRRIFEGRVLNLRLDEVLLPNNNISTREVIEHNGGVAVVAIDSDDNIIMVKQFRKPYEKELLEIPAGKLSKNENPLDCGIRELEEETGYCAKEFISLGELYPSPGYCNEVLYLYFAKDLYEGKLNLDEDEFLHSEKIPFNNALEMIEKGEIKDAKTIVAIMRTYLKRIKNEL